MPDSGIQSGSNTGAPSVSSKHGLDGLDACDDLDPQRLIYDFDNGYTQGGYTQEQVEGTYALLQLFICFSSARFLSKYCNISKSS